jgi:hypothetical protein
MDKRVIVGREIYWGGGLKMHYVDWYYTQHTCQKWNGFKASVLKLERFIKRHRANIPGPSNQKRVARCVKPQRSGSINVHCALMQADFYIFAIHKWKKKKTVESGGAQQPQ